MSWEARRIDDVSLILELVPTIAWATTPEGRLVYLNGFGKDYFGPEPEVAEQIWLMSHVPDSERARVADQWSERWQKVERWSSEFRTQDHAGSQRRMIFTARAARGPAGQLMGWVGSCVDVEEERIAADDLRHNAVEIGLLLADADVATKLERRLRSMLPED